MEGNDDKIIKKKVRLGYFFLSQEEEEGRKKERSFENLLLLLSLVRFWNKKNPT